MNIHMLPYRVGALTLPLPVRQLRRRLGPPVLAAVTSLCLLAAVVPARAVSLNGDAHIDVADPSGALSWSNNVDAHLTVQCWFKLSVPAGGNVTANMSIVCNKRNPSGRYAYHLFYDRNQNSVQFATAGAAGSLQFTLIRKPYFERWYHVAVVRASSNFLATVDGVSAVDTNYNVGDASSTAGVLIGAGDPYFGNKDLCGEVQEVSIYQDRLHADDVLMLLFEDQRWMGRDQLGFYLAGYYKLGYSTNLNDFDPNNLYRNFATPTGAVAGTGIGPILFEETNQKGEQSLFDSQANGGRNAITPLSGAFTWQHTAFVRPVPGVPFELTIGYCPGVADTLGLGWSHSYEIRASRDSGNPNVLKVHDWRGGVETWEITNDVAGLPWFTRHGEYRGELCRQTDGNIYWTNAQRQTYEFLSPSLTGPELKRAGTLKTISDFNGNRLEFQRGLNGLVTNVVDSTGGRYWFYYNDEDLLTIVSNGSWQVRFTYSNNIITTEPSRYLLTSKTLVNTSGSYTNVGATLRFAYNTNGMLERIIDARTNTAVIVGYDNYDRQIETKNALGQFTRTEYGVPGKRQVRKTDAAGFQWIETYDRKGRIITQRNPLGCETRYTYDARGNRSSITDANGNVTTFGYDSRGNPLAQTNALGEVRTNSYHPFFNKPLTQTDATLWTTRYEVDDVTGNVRRQYDDYGTLANYTYTNHGLLFSKTDANTNRTYYLYETNNWFRVAEIDAAGFTNSYLLNDVGWKLAVTNPLREVTMYAYDLNGKTVWTKDSLGRIYRGTYDQNGNQLTQVNGKNQTNRWTYDALNRKITEVDRAGATRRFSYTVRNKPEAITNALGFVTTFRYDAANGETNRTDALGNSETTVYDDNGNVVATIDKRGQRWTKSYDALNRVVAESDPFGNTTQTLFDPAGSVRETINPNGARTVNSYDGRGRLTNRVDAAGYTWGYAYDGVGNITGVTDTRNHQYRMAYGRRNERILEQNQDGRQWRYAYDALVRLSRQEEPNGTNTLAYDTGGRLTNVVFSTGRVNTFAYDANDNPTNLVRSGSGPPAQTQLDYDALDRIRSYRDVFANTVSYTYDPGGRLTNLTYPDGKTLTQSYDALDRLTNQVFRFGLQSHSASYAYDKADRLVRRFYPNGMVQTNSFDAAGRLTDLSHSGPSTLNIALRYAYDANGNQVRSQAQGLFQWPLPALRDEAASYTNSGELLLRDVVITNIPQPRISYHYDPNGNMTNAVAVDGSQNWALTYDEDNRTTSIHWEAGLTSKTVTNRYDALGRRIARTVNGVETRYVLDPAGSMERILCDVLPSGLITAWYVHGADLAFKVDVSGALTCYHTDAQGNVIALSGGDGSKLIEYAYTAYGRSLGSTNYIADPALDTQPFLFVGGQGVMMEEQGLPGLYFMRARYYSAEAGVFFSTDPEKNIGPTWLPIAYAYANCNPLAFNDPNGQAWNLLAAALGAIIGGLLGGAIDAIIQVATTGHVDWARVAGAAVAGAVTGAAAGLTMGASLVAQMVIGGIASGAGTFLARGVENEARGESFTTGMGWGTVAEVGVSAGMGALFSYAGASKFGTLKWADAKMNVGPKLAWNLGLKKTTGPLDRVSAMLLAKGGTDITAGRAILRKGFFSAAGAVWTAERWGTKAATWMGSQWERLEDYVDKVARDAGPPPPFGIGR